MNHSPFFWPPRLVVALALLLAGVLSSEAQFQRSQTGGTRNTGRSGLGGSRSGSSSRTYNNNGMVGEAMISSDPETRRIIVITDEETSQYVSQVITNLDRPKPQVLIKVVFVEVAHTDGSDIGIEGGFKQGIDSTTSGVGSDYFGLSGLGSVASNLNVNRFGQPLQSFAPVPPGAGLYQILGQDYEVTLRAIAQAGKAKVLSRPSILARNSQPATILVGQTVPLITSVRYDTLGNAINGITYQDVGIILKVTPFITSDGLVEMIVAPEISSVSETEQVQIQTGAYAPVIDKRAADTVVVTADRQTVVIGGLIQTIKAESESKIPLLGDIPGLGVLFRHRTKSDRKTELLIFLTPHIVQAPAQLAALSAQERAKSAAPKAFTQEELDRFLDDLPAKETPEPAKDKAPPASKPASKKQPASGGKGW